MSAAASTCYFTFDLSGFTGLPFSLANTYRAQWATFNRIQSYNLNVSTMRNAGDKTLNYYQFVSNTERGEFASGQVLHQRRYPTVNWNSVPND